MDEPTLADDDNTDEIIGAIRRIMATDEEVLTGEEGTGRFSKEAHKEALASPDRRRRKAAHFTRGAGA